MLYLDSRALVKRYIDEEGSDAFARILEADQDWSSGNHTLTEVCITLGRRLDGEHRSAAVARFLQDWDRTTVAAVDDVLCRRASDLGVDLRLRTLDALHLAAAERIGPTEMALVTFDLRLAAAARSLGFEVVGA